MDWLEKALCRGKHTDIWFPPLLKADRTAPESQYHEIAKMACDACPVRGKCQILGQDEEYGTWGGWTLKERQTGHWKPSKRVIAPQYVSRLFPQQDKDTRVDVPALRETLKRYSDKRS